MRLSEREFWRSTPRKLVLLWREYLRINGNGDTDETAGAPQQLSNNIVYRGGRPYRVVRPQDAAWIGNIMH